MFKSYVPNSMYAPRSFCKIHFPSVVQCYLVHWLNNLFIAWPMMRVQRGFVFNIA